MTVNWILEPKILDDKLDEVKSVINDFGDYAYEKEPYWQIKNGAKEKLSNLMDRPTLALCSLGAAQFINNTLLSPGVYCDLPSLKVSEYSRCFYDYMLNQYIYLPLWQIEKEKEKLYSLFGVNEEIFIRPNSAFKTFNGMILSKVLFSFELMDINNLVKNPFELVCVATPKTIYREWRLFIVRGCVVGASQYKYKGKSEILADCPDFIKEFAEFVISSSQFGESCYCMDIAETFFGPKIIELNSFSCSGLYACNVKDVLTAVRQVAVDDYVDNDIPF